jgi:hypothetical protein
MIFVVAPSGETWEFDGYLQTYGKELRGDIRILPLDEIVARQQVPLGSYVFLAIDQFSITEKVIAAQCWDKLRTAGADITLINNPSEVLLRHDLLKTCFERKRNSFRVWRALEGLGCRRFPVFLRRELDHDGSLTGLLHTRKELVHAVAKSLATGIRLRDLIVIEYCDTMDRSGIFRKYSAFIVGDTIVPHTLMHNRDWITKSKGRLIDAGTAREEFEYVQSNPHAKWLEQTFELAKTRYGRIDYGLRDGEPQVWEINTNPVIIRAPGADPLTEEQWRVRDPIRHLFFERFRTALEALDSTVDPGRTVRIDVSSGQLRKLAAEKLLRSRIQARKTALSLATDLVIRPLWRRAKRIGLFSSPG